MHSTRQQRVKHLRPIAKIRGLQASDRLRQVDQAAGRAAPEHAKRADHLEPKRERRSDRRAIIHQDQLGAKRLRERDRRALAVIE